MLQFDVVQEIFQRWKAEAIIIFILDVMYVNALSYSLPFYVQFGDRYRHHILPTKHVTISA